jgi:hypothetical protein
MRRAARGTMAVPPIGTKWNRRISVIFREEFGLIEAFSEISRVFRCFAAVASHTGGNRRCVTF